jgi:hypothetical protein
MLFPKAVASFQSVRGVWRTREGQGFPGHSLRRQVRADRCPLCHAESCWPQAAAGTVCASGRRGKCAIGSVWSRLEFFVGEEEFAGALRSLHDGFDQRNAEFAFFEFEDAVDGAARRSGHGVLE